MITSCQSKATGITFAFTYLAPSIISVQSVSALFVTVQQGGAVLTFTPHTAVPSSLVPVQTRLVTGLRLRAGLLALAFADTAAPVVFPVTPGAELGTRRCHILTRICEEEKKPT